MATIIRHLDSAHGPHAVAFNFDDLADQAGQQLSEAEAQAARILEDARQQADRIRQQAAKEGAHAAVQVVDQMVAEQLAPVLLALRQGAADLQHAKQEWLSQWESRAIHLASAIAARIVRGELTRQPQIPLTLIREALELAAGSPDVRLFLNPEDHQSLGGQVRAVLHAMSGVGGAEVMADATISRGGCRVETRFGTIDQQIESQLKRIEEELTG
jgi:flagellar assembly protein FliH